MNPDKLTLPTDVEEVLFGTWKELHKIPELGNCEHKTTGFIKNFLNNLGLELTPSPSGTGGLVVVGEGSDRVLLRADIDALPIPEATCVDFASLHPNVMHACGHDAHTAIMLALIFAISKGYVVPANPLLIMFQPAEEGPGGMAPFLEAGLLENHKITQAYAMHLWPGLNTGVVGLGAGALMAGTDSVNLTFVGKGGHGAHPEICVDPVLMACEALLSLQKVVTRSVDPLEPAIMSFGSIRGGFARNIIPNEVRVEGTIRWFNEKTRQTMRQAIERTAKNVAIASGGTCEVELISGYPPTVNDAQLVGRLAQKFKALEEVDVIEGLRTMGAEDMGLLLEKVPGVYLQVGSQKTGAAQQSLHSPVYLPDPDSLKVGFKVWEAVVSA